MSLLVPPQMEHTTNTPSPCRSVALSFKTFWTSLVLLSLGLALTAWILWSKSKLHLPLSSASTNAALLAAPKQQHLGKLLQFEKKDFSFTIKNNHSESVQILSVTHSCGCTESKVQKEILPAGESTQLTGSLNAQDRRGEFGSQILVTYQLGQKVEPQQTQLFVGAKAVTLLNAPNNLDLGSSFVGQELKPTTFTVTKGDADLAWDQLRIQNTRIVTTIKQEGTGKWQITLTPPREASIGNYREDLRLELLNGNQIVGQRDVSINWKTDSESFQIKPMGVYLSGARTGKIDLKSLTGRAITVQNIEYPKDAPFEIKQVRAEKGTGQIKLEVIPFPSQGKPTTQALWTGKIQLTLHDGLKQETCWIAVLK